MINLANTIDLQHDAEAKAYVKTETVEVKFATDTGVLTRRVGPNHFVAGDAIVNATDGEIWVVSRQRFDEKYLPVLPTVVGQAGHYEAKKVTVLAKQMSVAFTIRRQAGGDMLAGEPGDWLIEYAPGDFGVVLNQRFQRIYKHVNN